RRIDCNGGVGPHVADGDVEGWVAVLVHHDVARELDAAEVAVIRVGNLDRIIADDVVGRQVNHFFDQVLGIERRPEFTTLDADRDGFAVDLARIGYGRFDHAMRRRPDRPGTISGRAVVWLRLVARLLPGEFAADHRNCTLVSGQRLLTAA